MNKRESQNAEILKFLQSGRAISPLQALEMFGVFRLSGRVYDIRKQGHKIVTDTIHQNGKHFASYRLEKAEAMERTQ